MGKGKEMITLRELKEKAASKQQQKLMGLALAYKRGDVPEDEVSDTVRDLAKSMSTDELEKFAGTKHKGLPDKVDEGKSSTGYELYHRDFSSAMQHAYKHAKSKLGVDVDPKEIDRKVAMGPRKPSKGKTNKYRLLDKDGKKAIQVQVYGMDNGKYELNMYKESVDINEAFSDSQIAKLKKEYEPLRTKRISLDHNKKLNSIINKISHNKDALEKIYKADIPFVSQSAMVALMMKHNYKAADFNKLMKAVDEAVAIDGRTKTFKETMKRLQNRKKESVEERYSGKQVKMAMGIASDPRYKQGNYTGAVNKIEKIAKGLSKHPSVASYLKKMNEYLEIGTDEIVNKYAEMTPGQTKVKEAKTSGIDNAASAIVTGALGAVGLGAKKGIGKLAKKAKDRLDPVKVAAARRQRDQRKREREQAQREIDQRKRERARKRTQAVTNTARKAGQTLGNLKRKISGNPPRRPAG